ncbi:tetratricopeptide repeat protein [Falsiroseomonas ponticola]|uniref:tetratricopeptide repeat protein n=1 Tax=Falsiroseomonas ponticola TaxID=2786951 RepID=UPI001932D82A|nr:tetratricopeptide repeat protein [Roseomonas ponticola]
MSDASRFASQLSRFMLLASVAVITLPASPAYAQPNRVTACDVLTAHPDDRQRVADPVPITERDPARAIPACEEALRADPNNARLRYQLGLALDTARRFTESFAAYQQAARAGHVAAGHALGWAYSSGEGVERNDAEAVRWYRWAAERGHTGSMNTLGVMFENGRGVPRDLAQAADWYRRAYDTDGRVIAGYNFARLLAGGRGVPQDNARAVQLFRVAVQAGRADAALQLALMAERGEAPQVAPAELIQLLVLAETGSGQRDRALRSINQQIAAGNGAAVDAARRAATARADTQQREQEAVRQQREQAFARLSQPALAAAPTPALSAGSSAPSAASATAAASASPAAPAQIAWVGVQPPRAAPQPATNDFVVTLDTSRANVPDRARTTLQQVGTAARQGAGAVVWVHLADGVARSVAWDWSDPDAWQRMNAVATELMRSGVQPSQIVLTTGSRTWTISAGGNAVSDIRRIQVLLYVAGSQGIAAAPRAASVVPAPAPAPISSAPSAASPVGISTTLHSATTDPANWCRLTFEFHNHTGRNITLAQSAITAKNNDGRIIDTSTFAAIFSGRDTATVTHLISLPCRELASVEGAITSVMVDGNFARDASLVAAVNRGDRASLVAGIAMAGAAGLAATSNASGLPAQQRANPSDVTSLEGARAFIAGRTFEWRDETGVRLGIPVGITQMTFNNDASQCTVRGRMITQDNWDAPRMGSSSLSSGRYIDTGAQFVRINCSLIGFSVIIQPNGLSVGNSSVRWFARIVQ